MARHEERRERTEELLRRFGSDVKKGAPLFDDELDLGALHRALDDVDSARPARPRRSRIFARAAWAAAAALLVVIGLRWALPGREDAPRLTDMHISSWPNLVRELPSPSFRSGDDVYLHFHADRDGSAYVAMLTSALEFVPVGSEVQDLPTGTNSLGPFRLDDETGREAFIVLVGRADRSLEDYSELVSQAAASIETGSGEGFDARLSALRTALEDRDGLHVAVIPFEHLPR